MASDVTFAFFLLNIPSLFMALSKYSACGQFAYELEKPADEYIFDICSYALNALNPL
jgi:hypothetical protein